MRWRHVFLALSTVTVAIFGVGACHVIRFDPSNFAADAYATWRAETNEGKHSGNAMRARFHRGPGPCTRHYFDNPSLPRAQIVAFARDLPEVVIPAYLDHAAGLFDGWHDERELTHHGERAASDEILETIVEGLALLDSITVSWHYTEVSESFSQEMNASAERYARALAAVPAPARARFRATWEKHLDAATPWGLSAALELCLNPSDPREAPGRECRWLAAVR